LAWATKRVRRVPGLLPPALPVALPTHPQSLIYGKPGDLPTQQPTKFKLTVNLQMARSIGLTIPQPLRIRADVVIE